MAALLYIIAAGCVVANLTLHHTMNFGLQEEIQIMGYLGMAISTMFTIAPIFCVLAARDVQYWANEQAVTAMSITARDL